MAVSFVSLIAFCLFFLVSENKKEFIYSHPKLKKLEEIVIEHFKSRKMGCSGKCQQLKGKGVNSWRC